jgi:hypothetical protein
VSTIPRVTAIHEAGHVIGYWYVGQYVRAAHVQDTANLKAGAVFVDGRGRQVRGHGLTEGGNYATNTLLLAPIEAFPEESKDGIYQGARRDIIANLAGPIAEAKFSKQSLFSVLLSGGAEDWGQSEAIADKLPEGRRVLDEAEAIARRIIGRYWETVHAIADALQSRRTVEMEDLEGIIKDATGQGWRGFMCPMDIMPDRYAIAAKGPTTQN